MAARRRRDGGGGRSTELPSTNGHAAHQTAKQSRRRRRSAVVSSSLAHPPPPPPNGLFQRPHTFPLPRAPPPPSLGPHSQSSNRGHPHKGSCTAERSGSWRASAHPPPLRRSLHYPAAHVGGRVRRLQPTPPPPSVVRAPALSTGPRGGRPSSPPPLITRRQTPRRSSPTPVRDLPPPPCPPPPVSMTVVPGWGWGVSPRLPLPSSATVAPPPPAAAALGGGGSRRQAGWRLAGRPRRHGSPPRHTAWQACREKPGSASPHHGAVGPAAPTPQQDSLLCTGALAPLAATAGGPPAPPRGGLRDGDDTDDQSSRRPPRIRSGVVRWARHVKVRRWGRICGL